MSLVVGSGNSGVSSSTLCLAALFDPLMARSLADAYTNAINRWRISSVKPLHKLQPQP